MSIGRKHFVLLDGLRGIAALSVAILHVSQITGHAIIHGHAYLAVDFFFCLSGFVIACAYDQRLEQALSVGVFARLRLIRLYPMIIVGILLGVLATLSEPQNPANRFIAATFMGSLVFFPAGLLYNVQAYPLNNPLWSIAFELVANFCYAIVRKLGRSRGWWDAGALVAMAAMTVFASHWQNGVTLIGFADWTTYALGLVRIAFPFYAGVCIWRYRVHAIAPALPSWAVASLLLAMLWAPVVEMKWLYDVVAILLVVPLVIVVGPHSTLPRWSKPFWEFLGRVSYPLYAIHQPAFRLWLSMPQ